MTSPRKTLAIPLLIVTALALVAGAACAEYDPRGRDPALENPAWADDPYAYPAYAPRSGPIRAGTSLQPVRSRTIAPLVIRPFASS